METWKIAACLVIVFASLSMCDSFDAECKKLGGVPVFDGRQQACLR